MQGLFIYPRTVCKLCRSFPHPGCETCGSAQFSAEHPARNRTRPLSTDPPDQKTDPGWQRPTRRQMGDTPHGLKSGGF